MKEIKMSGKFDRVVMARKAPRHGLAATAVALLLFFAMGIVLVFTNRSLVFEQRTSANQYRYTKAFEAADAGLEWAIAQLNGKDRITAACAANTAGANAFKERYVNFNTTTGAVSTAGLRPTCVMSGGGYDCSCPSAGAASVSAAAGSAFLVEFSNAPQVGVIRATVYGCTSQAGPCHPNGTGSPDGTATVTALLGVIPALGTSPAAAITAKDQVSIGNAALGVVNPDPETNGITINAGSTIDAPKARITTIPGSPPSSSLLPNDNSLASITPDQMFQTFFGMSKQEYQQVAITVTCPSGGPCNDALTSAIADAPLSSRIFWVEAPGGMQLNGNLSFGDATNPLVVVVNGNITINGTMDITGLLYASDSSWDNTGGGSAFLRGAAVTEGSWTGNGTPDILFDSSVLKKLAKTPGVFIKIPGSWKDF
jgi:PilX N-terminal